MVDAPDRTLFLCGDVMTGRGIDQILPRPGAPGLFEELVGSAVEYVALAQSVNGTIPYPVPVSYVWGDALAELDAMAPLARIANLETAVTAGGRHWPGKGIHYRMHPANVGCLAAARIDVCALANNHVLDWGRDGLQETLETLHRAGIRTAGAGMDDHAAAAPAVVACSGPNRGGRVCVFSFAAGDSGVPADWAAAPGLAGVARLRDLAPGTVEEIAKRVAACKKTGDVAIASIHWGGNWGTAVPPEHRRFAHALIDRAGVDIVHGHSSHHPKGIEIYRDRLILYGCGDLLNDYEGIESRGPWRSDLPLMYFPRIAREDGRLAGLVLSPMRIRRFRLQRADDEEAGTLLAVLNGESARFGARFERRADGRFALLRD